MTFRHDPDESLSTCVSLFNQRLKGSRCWTLASKQSLFCAIVFPSLNFVEPTNKKFHFSLKPKFNIYYSFNLYTFTIHIFLHYFQFIFTIFIFYYFFLNSIPIIPIKIVRGRCLENLVDITGEASIVSCARSLFLQRARVSI